MWCCRNSQVYRSLRPPVLLHKTYVKRLVLKKNRYKKCDWSWCSWCFKIFNETQQRPWQRRCLNLFNFTGEDPLKICIFITPPPYPSIQESRCLVMLRFFRWKHLAVRRHQPIVPVRLHPFSQMHLQVTIAKTNDIVTITISPKKTTADLKRHQLKRRIAPKLPKTPNKILFPKPGE